MRRPMVSATPYSSVEQFALPTTAICMEETRASMRIKDEGKISPVHAGEAADDPALCRLADFVDSIRPCTLARDHSKMICLARTNGT
jgi:hypothetical protein